ncbi:MAG: hypothetical protein A3A90_00915 [Candidatus Zambryskibacteria bacterium RIFCSPLOWO2_01_FULL_35_19]|uniref:AAA+ ATPase domain-containing protein n=1 Tax=Candidatus Zambryskibacteria bacterium RIFCSPLOWO2_01_FULL_35_19 TaxID=1802757 RepID=A0A1G2U0J3_9BACT|nr:MAG: hypothetical protein A3A90_00915 [Candidatus Zambryskibacteria bacterium RIFCSPLOWO2_01_FULL_35_19]
MENINFDPKNKAKIENVGTQEGGNFIDDVIFEEQQKKSGEKEYKSSSPSRKIIILAKSSPVPEPGYPYKVRVVEDTNPEDPMSGKLFVEIIPITENSIEETESSVSYLGVGLEKAKNGNGQFIPRREQYQDFINDKEVALPLQRDIAVAFVSGEPLLVDGGTSLGKTTTVKKMAAELGWEIHYANLNGATDVEDLMGRYIPNPHKNKPEDPEYIFADGKVTSGLRQEEGKTKIIILDEFNASAPNILIRLHEVLDSLERGGDVVLSEDASEAVAVNKEKTKIIALMNPPGKGYFGREPLDPAQLRRWVYKKLPTELPEGTFSFSTDALFGIGAGTQNITPDMFLRARGEGLTTEQLQDIQGLPEVLEKFKEFHKAAKELLKNRKIAEDQPQPFTYDDRMEPRRVRDFILRFYNGDINETMQQALRYYYANKLESDADRKKLGELIRLVEYKPKPGESKRKSLETAGISPEKAGLIKDIEKLKAEVEASGKLSKPERRTSPDTLLKKMELAKEMLGKDYMGPEKIEKTFGIKVALEDIPDMPYSPDDLEKAKENGEMLVLGVDKDSEGKFLTISHMLEMIPELIDPATGEKIKVLYGQDKSGAAKLESSCWYKDEPFYTGINKDGTPIPNTHPRLKWRLTTKAPLPESVTTSYGGKAEGSTNYIEQTKILREYLISLGSLTEDEAKECSDKVLEEINEIMKSDWQEAARRLSELTVNKNHRRLPPEVLYDILLSIKGNNERILEKTYDWTAALSSYGELVDLGLADRDGVDVNNDYPGLRYDYLGVVSLR